MGIRVGSFPPFMPRGIFEDADINAGADHTFFAGRSFSAALLSMTSASSFFNLAFSLSNPFSRLASETSSPPYLMGWSAPSAISRLAQICKGAEP